MGMICMNTKSHHKLLLYLLWPLLELWHGLGIVVLQESIVVFALGHIFGRIAGLCVLVVHQAQLAALFARGNSVQADVEFGTVRGISVFRMRIREAKDFPLGFELGALETVLRYLMFGRTAGPFSLGRPVADTTELVKPEAG
jgi:hypothetical protein